MIVCGLRLARQGLNDHNPKVVALHPIRGSGGHRFATWDLNLGGAGRMIKIPKELWDRMKIIKIYFFEKSTQFTFTFFFAILDG
jgi:hypothetical protein